MRSRFLRKHYALPNEHGAWIWLLGPFVLGAAAGGHIPLDLLLLLLAGLGAFLLRKPTTIVVKVLSGRRHRRQLRPAMVWVAIYGSAVVLLLAALIGRGHGRLLLLAIPGIPVFLWHLWLVRGREERGQPGIEIIAAGVLSLMAPAAYWVAGGASPALAALLWTLSWLQSAASIVNVHLRLRQRDLAATPPLGQRVRLAARSLSYHAFNLVASIGMALSSFLPGEVPAAYALMSIDALEVALRPRPGARPGRIGLRQLVASIVFFALCSWGFAA